LRLAASLLVLALPALAAADRPVLEISGATFRPYPLAVPAAQASGDPAVAAQLDEALLFDLGISGIFDVIPRKAYLADAKEPWEAEQIAWPRWSDVAAQGLVKIHVAPGKATFRLFDVAGRKQELERTVEAKEPRRLGHLIANELTRYFTHEPGPFDTQLAYVRRTKGAKEVWISDFDGAARFAVTERGGITMLPAWAPRADQVAFTYYRRTPQYPNGKPEIWVADLPRGTPRPLITRGEGLLTGPAYSPDGKQLAYVMSEDGNPEIWVANRDGSGPRRLTSSPGIDTSPAWSPDGKKLAFVSDRHGTPQIFVMDADGGNVERITRQGNYNQTPAWSPRGNEIAFTARDERLVFDVFVVSLEKGDVRRITQDQGNNEHPTWAPNGRLLTFQSTRDGASAIYVSSGDGNVQKRVSPADGAEYTAPAWGPLR
jgi:TolB protein